MKIFRAFLSFRILCVLGLLAPALPVAAQPAQKLSNRTAFDFAFETIDGKPMPLEQFKGNVLLVVNTASQCGFTEQYAGLQALHEKHHGKGLVLIGVPSNEFDQETGDNAAIAKFCKTQFNITFPLTSKQNIKKGRKSPDAAVHEFYRWARAVKGDEAVPKWNFHKLLVSRDGKLIDTFLPEVNPDNSKLVKAIEMALNH